MEKKILFILSTIIFSIILISLVSATPSYVFKRNVTTDLKIPVFDVDNKKATVATNCFITISSPNQTLLVDDKQMDYNAGGNYNYTITYNLLENLGEYPCSMRCDDGVNYGFSTFTFQVTPDGTIPSQSQGWISIGILISIILVTFFFALLAFKLTDYSSMYPVALFFLVLSIISAIYGIYMGVVFSRDYLYASTAAPQSQFFIAVLYGSVGMAFVALLWLMIKVISFIKVRNEQKKYGDGYNSSSRTYNY